MGVPHIDREWEMVFPTTRFHSIPLNSNEFYPWKNLRKSVVVLYRYYLRSALPIGKRTGFSTWTRSLCRLPSRRCWIPFTNLKVKKRKRRIFKPFECTKWIREALCARPRTLLGQIYLSWRINFVKKMWNTKVNFLYQSAKPARKTNSRSPIAEMWKWFESWRECTPIEFQR